MTHEKYYQKASKEELESRLEHLKRLEKKKAKLLVRTTWPSDAEPIKKEMLAIFNQIVFLEELIENYEES